MPVATSSSFVFFSLDEAGVGDLFFFDDESRDARGTIARFSCSVRASSSSSRGVFCVFFFFFFLLSLVVVFFKIQTKKLAVVYF